ncbi:MAG: T9SS type A sorting domain-containing protein [Crocinitomicaceae bacterium]
MRILFFCWFGITTSAFGQVYLPMLSQFNEWQVTNCNNSCLTDVYYTYKDTSFNGNTYHILDGYHYISGTFLLREDITERKVYLHLITGSKNGEEYLLYDFSLQLGDSMEVHNPISPYPTDAGYFLLDSIITQTHVDGNDYRHFFLTALDTTQSLSTGAIWIEGIGSRSLINTPGAPPDFNQAGNLSCFFNHQTLHYSDLDSIGQCVQVNTDLGLTDLESSALQLFPNPAHELLNVKLSLHSKGELILRNLSGKQLMRLPVQPLELLLVDVSHLVEGVYIIQFESDHGEVITKRLVVF